MDDGQQDDRAAAPRPDGHDGQDDQDGADGSADELQMFTGEAGRSLQPHRFDTSLPFAEQSAALARGELLEFLRPFEAPRAAVENASTVLYELIRNGIDHGEPCQDHTLEVCWEVEDGELILRVTDCGTPSGTCPPGREEACEAGGHDHEQKWREKLLRPIEADALRGRGLHLVAALSDSWDVETTEGGTTVSATIRLG